MGILGGRLQDIVPNALIASLYHESRTASVHAPPAAVRGGGGRDAELSPGRGPLPRLAAVALGPAGPAGGRSSGEAVRARPPARAADRRRGAAHRPGPPPPGRGGRSHRGGPPGRRP